MASDSLPVRQASLPIEVPHAPEHHPSAASILRDDLLSQSHQSSNTVRRRSDVGLDPVQSNSTEETSSAHDLSHSRTATSLQSPRLTLRARTRKMPIVRRTSSTTPHRGEVFSVDDDPREVEADAVERRREQSLSIRRRTGTVTRLPRLPSSEHDGEGASEPHEADPTRDEPVPVIGPPQGVVPDLHNENIAPDEDEEAVLMDEYDDYDDSSEADDDAEGAASDAESFTLKDRQRAINETHPFGIRLWKPALYKKDRSVLKTAEGDLLSKPGLRVSPLLLFFNLLWTLLFGWWMATLTAIGALTCFLFAAAPSGRDYAHALWGLSGYLLYPFGKLVRLRKDDNYSYEDRGEGRSISEYEQWQSEDVEHGRLFFGPNDRSRSIVGRSRRSIDSEPSETDSLLGRRRSEPPIADHGQGQGQEQGQGQGPRTKRRLFGRGQWNIGRVIFFVFFYLLITPALLIVSAICWLLVFWIPMGRVTLLLFDHLRRHPLALSFESETTSTRSGDARSSSVLLCTYRAVGLQYWKYTIDGTNVFFINLIAVVFFVIFDWLVLDRMLHLEIPLTSPAFLFTASLVSIIPLAYFIGQAVASISAQSSMGLGAAVNAFFSTIVEVYLYCVALSQGKSRLVEGSIVGSIFAGILFLPGLSMCCGAIKRKTQRFNAKSAGVTSTMLLFAVLSAFSPTLFYQIYGTNVLHCQDCVSAGSGSSGSRDCSRCFLSQSHPLDDPFYLSAVRPFSYINAGTLFLAYMVGLWFTLRTHAAVIWNADIDDRKQDDHLASSIVRPSQSHAFAAQPNGDIRESQMYKRILGQSLKQAGLLSRLDEPSRQLSMNSVGTGAKSPLASGSSPHVVPPKPVGSDTLRSTMSMAGIPGLSEAQNQSLVREVAEIAATAVTLAARDTIRRRTSMHPGQSARPSTAARAAGAGFADAPEAGGAGGAGGGENSVAGHGHVAPNWSRIKSVVILLGATVLYAIIAEILVDTVDVVLVGSQIDEKFLGITLFALVPNTTEFLNAISFAMNGNIALSMEIGSAYALQVCLLQIPALVLFSALYPMTTPGVDAAQYTFSLLFPQWDLVTVILCVFLLSYMYGEGKSNYFKGSILLLSYFVVVCGFYFSGFASPGADRR